jgi:iron complex transport system ATP-binding protein
MSVLSCEALALQRAKRLVLADLSFQIEAGAMVGIVGPNGAGKSSLLRVLAGLAPVSSGEVRLKGKPIGAWAASERARVLGYLPQHPQLLWPLSVREVVALGRRPYDETSAPAAQEAAIDGALVDLSLTAFAGRDARQLSGGEQMRVHLARLTAGTPAVYLVDEPTAALDPRAQLEVMNTLQGCARAGAAVLLVLHDLPLAARYCDRLLVLHKGRAVICAEPAVALNDARLAEVFGVAGLRGEVNGRTELLSLTALQSNQDLPA